MASLERHTVVALSQQLAARVAMPQQCRPQYSRTTEAILSRHVIPSLKCKTLIEIQRLQTARFTNGLYHMGFTLQKGPLNSEWTKSVTFIFMYCLFSVYEQFPNY